MRYRWVLILVGLFVVGTLAHPRVGATGEAIDQLRADIDDLYQAVDQSASRPPGQAAAPARAIMDRMFDWTAMAEASLQRHWQKLTAVERSEFTRLFADVFARAYVAQMHLVDNRTFQYLGETTLGDRGTVKTSVFTRRGKPIDVEYVVRPTPAGRWHVHDVRVETISLVDNYRVQFDSILSRSSYDELVKRLRTATR